MSEDLRATSRKHDTATVNTERPPGGKVHADQIGDPDEDACVTIGVQNSRGPDPVIPGYVPRRIYIEHVAHPPRLVTYEPRGPQPR